MRSQSSFLLLFFCHVEQLKNLQRATVRVTELHSSTAATSNYKQLQTATINYKQLQATTLVVVGLIMDLNSLRKAALLSLKKNKLSKLASTASTTSSSPATPITAVDTITTGTTTITTTGNTTTTTTTTTTIDTTDATTVTDSSDTITTFAAHIPEHVTLATLHESDAHTIIKIEPSVTEHPDISIIDILSDISESDNNSNHNHTSVQNDLYNDISNSPAYIEESGLYSLQELACSPEICDSTDSIDSSTHYQDSGSQSLDAASSLSPISDDASEDGSTKISCISLQALESSTDMHNSASVSPSTSRECSPIKGASACDLARNNTVDGVIAESTYSQPTSNSKELSTEITEVDIEIDSGDSVDKEEGEISDTDEPVVYVTDEVSSANLSKNDQSKDLSDSDDMDYVQTVASTPIHVNHRAMEASWGQKRTPNSKQLPNYNRQGKPRNERRQHNPEILRQSRLQNHQSHIPLSHWQQPQPPLHSYDQNVQPASQFPFFPQVEFLNQQVTPLVTTYIAPPPFHDALQPPSFMKPLPPIMFPGNGNIAVTPTHSLNMANGITMPSNIPFPPTAQIPNASMIFAALLSQRPEFFLLSKLLEFPPHMQANALLASPYLWSDIRDQICMMPSLGIELLQLPDFGIHYDVVQACLNHLAEIQPVHTTQLLPPHPPLDISQNFDAGQSSVLEFHSLAPISSIIDSISTQSAGYMYLGDSQSHSQEQPESLMHEYRSSTAPNPISNETPLGFERPLSRQLQHQHDRQHFQSKIVRNIPLSDTVNAASLKTKESDAAHDASTFGSSDLALSSFAELDNRAQGTSPASHNTSRLLKSLSKKQTMSTSDISMLKSTTRTNTYSLPATISAANSSVYRPYTSTLLETPIRPRVKFLKERPSSYVIDLSDPSDDSDSDTEYLGGVSRNISRSSSLRSSVNDLYQKSSSTSTSMLPLRSSRSSFSGSPAGSNNGSQSSIKRLELENKIKELNMLIEQRMQTKIASTTVSSESLPFLDNNLQDSRSTDAVECVSSPPRAPDITQASFIFDDPSLELPEDRGINTPLSPDDPILELPEDRGINTPLSPDGPTLELPEDRCINTPLSPDDPTLELPEDRDINTPLSPDGPTLELPEDRCINTPLSPDDPTLELPEDRDINTPLSPDDTNISLSGSTTKSVDEAPLIPVIDAVPAHPADNNQYEKMIAIILESNTKTQILLKAIQEQCSTVALSISIPERKETETKEKLGHIYIEQAQVDEQIITLEKRQAMLSAGATKLEDEVAELRKLVASRRDNLAEYRLREKALEQDLLNGTTRLQELQLQINKKRSAAAAWLSSSGSLSINTTADLSSCIIANSADDLASASDMPIPKRPKLSDAVPLDAPICAISPDSTKSGSLYDDIAPTVIGTDPCHVASSSIPAVSSVKSNNTTDPPIKPTVINNHRSMPILDTLGISEDDSGSSDLSDFVANLLSFDTIQPLYDFGSNFLQSKSEIAYFSRLSSNGSERPAADLIPERSVHSNISLSRSASSLNSFKMTNGTTSFSPFKMYTSPLSRFRSFQHTNSKEGTEPKQSLTWSRKLDPKNTLCQYETRGGRCWDTTCAGQHFRDIALSDDEYFTELMETSAHLLTSENIGILQKELHLRRRGGAKVSELISTVLATIRAQDSALLDKNLFISAKMMAVRPTPNITPSDSDNSGGNLRYLLETSFSLPPSPPLLFSGMAKLARGEVADEKRYYERALLQEEYESLLHENAHNVDLWVRYAVSELKAPITNETIEKVSSNFNSALLILGRALIPNRSSECLWVMYIELYQRRGDPHDTRELFQQAINFLPRSVIFWWMWFLFESTQSQEEQLCVLKRMMVHLAGPVSRTLDSEKRSIAILSCCVQTAKCLVSMSRPVDATQYLSVFLERKPLQKDMDISFSLLPDVHPIDYLDPSHRAVLLLLSVHLSSFGFIPSNAFYDYPHHYLVQPRLFLIEWNHPLCRLSQEVTETISELFTMWLSTQADALDPPGTGRTIEPWLCAVIRNYSAMLRIVHNRSQAHILEDIHLWVPCDYMTLFDRMQCGLIDVRPTEALASVEKSLTGSPASFTRVNAACQLSLLAQNINTAVSLLTNSIRTCFTDMPMLSVSEAWSDRAHTISLYSHAMGLELLVASNGLSPEFKPTIQRCDLQSNFHLWANFILFTEICGVERTFSLASLFDSALKYIKGADGRAYTWMEYLRLYLPDQDTTSLATNPKQALQIFELAVSDIRISTPHPFSTLYIGSCDFLRLLSLQDNGWTTEIANHLVMHLDLSLAESFISLIASQYPNVHPLPRSILRLMKAQKVDASRLILTHHLRTRTDSDLVWRLAIQLEAACLTPKRQNRFQWLVDQARRHLKGNSLICTQVRSLMFSEVDGKFTF
ncbi:hypothetical protein BASA61_000457 [Batrachochytrium salamandrivorans]|nr:hypothetical protein BASA61_000457 [Batrachochytrium salamandrivorans]